MKYTNEKTSKQLRKWGCDLETSLVYINGNICHVRQDDLYTQVKCYDLHWDVCVKYAKEFFGERHDFHSLNVFVLLMDKNIEGVNAYLLEHTIFNPKNK